MPNSSTELLQEKAPTAGSLAKAQLWDSLLHPIDFGS